MKLLIAIPTYNEAENIERFIKAVFDSLQTAGPVDGNVNRAGEAAVIVIDDNSPDGTADIVEKLVPQYPGRLHLLKRPGKLGLGTAYLAAFDWGLSLGYDVFLEMDADFSHNPSYIPAMLKEIETHDVVIGSRNVSGGCVEGWSALRTFISKGGSLYARLVLGCDIKDLTGGFNMWTKAALERINLSGIISKGYSFQVEMKFRAYSAGCRIKEIPIIFVDRKMGKSKMSKKIFVEALLNMWKIKKIIGADSGIDQFIKFVVTGALGTVTNLLIFFLCADIFNLHEIPVSIFCFLIAASQNYVINHRWSFRQNTAREALSFKKWLEFTGASLLGLTVNIVVMKAVLSNFAPSFKVIAQACGIAAGMVINFILSKLFVFRKKSIKEH
ncbi:MAG: glycosyltransferase family 2 protein [Spirochaetaceae bacterium]|jgi:dolichol-phosphate mannosyltransferase|nr:glycosyltransferase family 2 protein [Spirochaetaceae bacterium]